MNAHSRKLIKPGDVFTHMETGDVYKLLSLAKTVKSYRQPQEEIIYKFLDIKTNQIMEYTWGMFRDRLKFAPQSAQLLYAEKNGEVKTGRENIDEPKT